MAVDLSGMNEVLKMNYLPLIRQQLFQDTRPMLGNMNKFDMFTWRGKPVICPNCDPDHRMNYSPSTEALYCTRCELEIDMRDIHDLKPDELTVGMLDYILQKKMRREEKKV
jgi:hypothetical protein